MRLAIGDAFFPSRIRSALLRYGIAVSSIGLVAILTLLFYHALNRTIPVALVYFAIIVTAWYAGLGPGLSAAFLGLIATDIVMAQARPDWANLFIYARLFSFTLLALMMTALREAGDKYRRDQERLLELERSARAAAEESSRRHQQIEDRLTVLVEASGALLTSLEMTSVTQRILEMARSFVGADAYAIWRGLFIPSSEWEISSSEGLSENFRARFFEGMAEMKVDPNVAVAVEDIQSDPRFVSRRNLYVSEGIRSLLTLPMRRHEGRPLLISFYYRKHHQFPEGEVRVALALTNLAGSALLLAELYEEQIRLRADAQDVTEALQHSNQELQQFAYVVSHDLQEPLRMVGSYVDLLASRYRGQLDDDADEFISYVKGGVNRMHALIRDLLAYSRVTDPALQQRAYVSLESVLEDVLLNLRTAIAGAGAAVTHDPLPKVLTFGTQFTQLLQNLIGNAIKYRREEPPRIHVSAEKRGREWVFSICDNGIGMEDRHYERIFGIFKRLHGPEYPGTGIGLAISKRIVERNRGRIWVESKVGEGSTFCFTLPADIVSVD